jgi:glutathione S-transferase
VLVLYDAPRCPYCARARIVLAEKGVSYETVEIDLDDRPALLYERNPAGRVPVLEEGSFVLPESAAIMEYAEERWPEPPLLPGDLEERALARLELLRFDDLAGPYYRALFQGDDDQRVRLHEQLGRLDARLARQPFLTGAEYGLVDIGYVPWILRARDRFGVELEPYPGIVAWLARLAERPAIAAELETVAALAV